MRENISQDHYFNQNSSYKQKRLAWTLEALKEYTLEKIFTWRMGTFGPWDGKK